jgi:S-layer family protein
MRGLLLVVVSTLLVGAASATAADDTYGTASLTSVSIGAMQFISRTNAAINTLGGNSRYGGGVLDANVSSLPSGAQIERIEIRGCDTDPAEEILVLVGACASADGNCSLAGLAGTAPASATPGCGDFSAALTTPLIVNNQFPILFEVETGNTPATTFSSVKVYYRLRVSPAPATATFPSDVPTTHPFFRFVEALAAAGITGGCGTGSYCPDAPVTRGQMAVFLATALGLHFPN